MCYRVTNSYKYNIKSDQKLPVPPFGCSPWVSTRHGTMLSLSPAASTVESGRVTRVSEEDGKTEVPR